MTFLDLGFADQSLLSALLSLFPGCLSPWLCSVIPTSAPSHGKALEEFPFDWNTFPPPPPPSCLDMIAVRSFFSSSRMLLLSPWKSAVPFKHSHSTPYLSFKEFIEVIIIISVFPIR